MNVSLRSFVKVSRSPSVMAGFVDVWEETVKSIPHSFYESRQWLDCKEAYLKKVNRFCERCKADGIYELATIVHHKKYLNADNYRDPSVSLNFDNLEALCQKHHNQEHHGTKTEPRYVIKDGKLIF